MEDSNASLVEEKDLNIVFVRNMYVRILYGNYRKVISSIIMFLQWKAPEI